MTDLLWWFAMGFMFMLGALTARVFWRWAQREGAKWAAKEWQGLRW